MVLFKKKDRNVTHCEALCLMLSAIQHANMRMYEEADKEICELIINRNSKPDAKYVSWISLYNVADQCFIAGLALGKRLARVRHK